MSDFSPPSVLNASLLLTPPAGSLIQSVTRITNGTRLKLVVTASERLRDAPVLKLVHNELERGFAEGLKVGGELSTTFEYVLDPVGGFDDDPAQQGLWTVDAILVDLAGNEWSGELNLAQGFLVDTLEAAALSGGATDGMRLYRNPWGSEETAYTPLIEVRGCGDPTVGAAGFDWCPDDGLERPENGSHIVLYKSTVSAGEVVCTDNALAVGTEEIGEDSWAVTMLVDMPVVCVGQIDQAGNKSAPVPVELVEWVATLNGKIAGGNMANPHRLLEVISHNADVMPRLGSEAVEVLEQSVLDGTMQAKDGQAASNSLRAGWQRFSNNGLEPPDVEGTVPVTFDPWRGRPLQVGGTAESAVQGWYQDEPGSETWEFDGRNWNRRMPPVEPPRRAGHAMAWDAVRGRLVIFGGATPTNGILPCPTWDANGRAGVAERTTTVSPICPHSIDATKNLAGTGGTRYGAAGS